MARKAKVNEKKFQRKSPLHRREENTTEKRLRYLIVCEGEKTEPAYFNALKNDLPKGIVTIEVFGAGDHTTNLVEAAKQKRKQAVKNMQPFDRVWVVLDRDSFPADRFNAAVEMAKQEEMGCAYSNEAFELWYLLHFDFIDTGISRSQYGEMLTAYLGFEYQKTATNIYKTLQEKGNQKKAIKFAEKLEKLHADTSPADANPCTKVHLLVKELDAFRPKPQ